jgi:hypothetical protein
MTVPARRPEDPVLDALDRLVDWASWRIDRPSVELIAATVRSEAERLREERDAADSQVEHFKRLWGTVEAWVRQLREDTRRLTAELKLAREGLREIEKLDGRYADLNTARHIADRALLSANPPQGDTAAFCEHGYTTEDSAHPSAGLERCPTCSPSDGGGA